jgi:histidine triad (HIT) family protein
LTLFIHVINYNPESGTLNMKINCIFCDIIAGKSSAEVVYQNERVIIFKDHRPQAKIHLLVCPKKHFDTFMDTPSVELAYLFKVCRALAEKLKVENGFRMVINNGPQGGQIIYHIHVHFMAWTKSLDVDRLELNLD